MRRITAKPFSLKNSHHCSVRKALLMTMRFSSRMPGFRQDSCSRTERLRKSISGGAGPPVCQVTIRTLPGLRLDPAAEPPPTVIPGLKTRKFDS
jgi:hypothetical protein